MGIEGCQGREIGLVVCPGGTGVPPVSDAGFAT
jgi:hypothetical protein